MNILRNVALLMFVNGFFLIAAHGVIPELSPEAMSCKRESAAEIEREANRAVINCEYKDRNACARNAEPIKNQAILWATQCCEEGQNSDGKCVTVARQKVYDLFQTVLSSPLRGTVAQDLDAMTEEQGGSETDPIVTGTIPPVPLPADRRPGPQPMPQPVQSPPTSLETAASDPSAEAQADIAACQRQQQMAVKCCGNPESCISLQKPETASSNKGSLTCQKLKTLAIATNDYYAQLGASCGTEQSGCETACGNLMTKYQGLLSKCGTCAQESVYAHALSTLSQSNRQCVSLASKVAEIRAKATDASVSAGAYEDCKERTADKSTEQEQEDSASAPMSLADIMENNKSTNDTKNTDDCESNPNAARCQKQVAEAKAPETGKSTYAPPEKKLGTDPQDFDVSDVRTPDAYVPSTGLGTSEAPTVNSVPNGGGAMPGGMSGNSPMAAANAGAKPMAPKTSYSTEIFPGGFVQGYSTPVFAGESRDRSTDYGNRRPSSREQFNEREKFKVGMDLKKYLPGGKLDPNRFNVMSVGGSATGHKDITGRFTDNFNKVNAKFLIKCQLQELGRCDE